VSSGPSLIRCTEISFCASFSWGPKGSGGVATGWVETAISAVVKSSLAHNLALCRVIQQALSIRDGTPTVLPIHTRLHPVKSDARPAGINANSGSWNNARTPFINPRTSHNASSHSCYRVYRSFSSLLRSPLLKARLFASLILPIVELRSGSWIAIKLPSNAGRVNYSQCLLSCLLARFFLLTGLSRILCNYQTSICRSNLIGSAPKRTNAIQILKLTSASVDRKHCSVAVHRELKTRINIYFIHIISSHVKLLSCQMY